MTLALDRIEIESVGADPVGLARALTACASTGRVTERSQLCAGWKPILVSQADRLTEETAQQVLAHNEFGKAQGCW